ncbi:hypothetical protein ACFYO7_31130 [Nocardia salmonicida]|uniref:hypothetical protein n=1 Tax=Nocardia salmonicida TaxID=53431 RepID=UPI00369B8D06
MWRYFAKPIVWQHFSTGLVLLGASATGSIGVYGAYVDQQRQRHEIDHARWDWAVPDDWYRQMNS